MGDIDWERDIFKVVYSSTFDSFGGWAVSIYRRRPGRRNAWDLVLPDMSPSILKRCEFPDRLVEAAELVSMNEKSVIVS